MKKINNKGFTLIEVLLVVAIIALLAGIVILAINPNRQLGQSKNAERAADVTTILNAVYQYALDNDGDLPPNLAALGSNVTTEICNTSFNGSADCTGLVDLSVLDTNEAYLVDIPIDPSVDGATADGADYDITRTGNNRVTVEAPSAENGESISVTR